MQTFLPLPDFTASARVLDRQRLGKQRVEVLQLLRALAGLSPGWANHPCARMWRGSEWSLGLYGAAVCQEWTRRGYRDSCLAQIRALATDFDITPAPAWLGSEPFHSAHRAALLAKAPEHYGKFSWAETPKVSYVWPKGAEA